MSQDWKQGTCGCLGDCETCLCGTFCLPCLQYRNGNDLGQSGLFCCLLACFGLPCLPVFCLRGEARERYGIEGSVAGDAVCAFCCNPCASCQTANEIKERGDHN